MTPAVLSYRELLSISRSDPRTVPDFGQVGEVGRIRPADLIPVLEMRAQEQRVTYWETIWGSTELREHVWWVPLPSSPRDQSTVHTHQVPPLTRDAQPRIWVARFLCTFKNEGQFQTSTSRLLFMTGTEHAWGPLSGRVLHTGLSSSWSASHSGLCENF